MTTAPEAQAVFKPRPKQREVLRYRRGKMGVSAVPGSGKTQTLSYLAASLIARGVLADDQEILIVTLVNSAVDNFAQRIARFVEAQGLLRRCRQRVFLGLSELNEQGNDQKGPLLKAIQRVLRGGSPSFVLEEDADDNRA